MKPESPGRAFRDAVGIWRRLAVDVLLTAHPWPDSQRARLLPLL